jgi:peptidoglycan/LPS O-acetylase OafA/YrhL
MNPEKTPLHRESTQGSPDMRLHELDSIRGIAALSVVLFHFFLGWTFFAHASGWQSIALKVFYPLYSGPEAVRLFFVLSGLVLALPYLRGRGQRYPIFAVRRTLRIYGPYLVALAIGIAGAAVFHNEVTRQKMMDCCWSKPVSLRLVTQHVLFLGDYDFAQFNVVIWSLVQEMRISLVFPLLFLVVDRLSTRKALILAAGCTATAMLIIRFRPEVVTPYVAMSLVMTVHYLAFFILGILIAKNFGAIGRWYELLSGVKRGVLLGVSLVMYSLSGMAAVALLGTHIKLLVGTSDWGTVVGAIGIIVTGLFSAPMKRLLLMRIPRFLGRISYSLYLTHVPVLLVLALTLRPRGISLSALLPIYLASALVVGSLFCLWVEEPFTRLSHRIRDTASPGQRMPELDRAFDATP